MDAECRLARTSDPRCPITTSLTPTPPPSLHAGRHSYPNQPRQRRPELPVRDQLQAGGSDHDPAEGDADHQVEENAAEQDEQEDAARAERDVVVLLRTAARAGALRG